MRGVVYLLEARLMSLIEPWLPALTAQVLEDLQRILDPSYLKLLYAVQCQTSDVCLTESPGRLSTD